MIHLQALPIYWLVPSTSAFARALFRHGKSSVTALKAETATTAAWVILTGMLTNAHEMTELHLLSSKRLDNGGVYCIIEFRAKGG